MADEYDDKRAVQKHLDRYLSAYMTDFERRCDRLGSRREKAELDPGSDWAARVRKEWEREASPEIRQALADGVANFRERVRRRITEATSLRRCPRCHRLLRTPRASQCFSCGHDWHHIADPADASDA